MSGTGQLSPLMTKLFTESDLRSSAHKVSVNPDTGRMHGLSDRGTAVVETTQGSMRVQVAFDPAVMPGIIEAAVGPDPACLGRDWSAGILSVCRIENDGTWRATRAKVREA